MIWDNAFYSIRPPSDLTQDIGTFRLVEGRVLDAARVRGTTYLNFGEDWRNDFTIAVRRDSRAAFEEAGFDLVEMVLADADDWDRYVASQWLTVSDWLRANPDDPEADDLRAWSSAARRSHLEYGRRYLGWGVFVLRPST